MSVEWLTDIFSNSVSGTLSRFGWVGVFVDPTCFCFCCWLTAGLTSDVFLVLEVEE